MQQKIIEFILNGLNNEDVNIPIIIVATEAKNIGIQTFDRVFFILISIFIKKYKVYFLRKNAFSKLICY